MKEKIIDFNAILEEFINPPRESMLKNLLRSKDDIKQDLKEKFEKSLSVKDLLKTHAWKEILRPKIIASLKNGFGRILKQGLEMSELELKKVIAEMRANISLIADLKYLVETGEQAGERLAKIESHET